MLTLELCLVIQVDDEDSEDQSLIELAGEMLEESWETDIMPESLEFPDSVLFLEATFDGVLTAEPDLGGLLVPASTFLLKEFRGHLPILPDELLPEDIEVDDFVLVAAKEAEEDLDDNVVLGTMPREPPGMGAFDSQLTLPEPKNGIQLRKRQTLKAKCWRITSSQSKF